MHPQGRSACERVWLSWLLPMAGSALCAARGEDTDPASVAMDRRGRGGGREHLQLSKVAGACSRGCVASTAACSFRAQRYIPFDGAGFSCRAMLCCQHSGNLARSAANKRPSAMMTVAAQRQGSRPPCCPGRPALAICPAAWPAVTRLGGSTKCVTTSERVSLYCVGQLIHCYRHERHKVLRDNRLCATILFLVI